jgi:hypothetical protein
MRHVMGIHVCSHQDHKAQKFTKIIVLQYCLNPMLTVTSHLQSVILQKKPTPTFGHPRPTGSRPGGPPLEGINSVT